MAKKKSKLAPAESLDASFRAMFDRANHESGGSGIVTEEGRIKIGIPVKPLSWQWLFGNDGFTLGRLTVLAGESGSCKTAFLCDIMRWHLAYKHSVVNYLLTEPRDVEDLRLSIVDPKNSQRILVNRCASIEDWQRGSTQTVKHLEELYGKTGMINGGPESPLMVGVDSLTAVTSENNVKNIEEDGHATVNFPVDANIISSYFKFIFNRVSLWPMSWICTSHVKFDRDPRYGHLKARLPGGLSTIYHATYILMFKKMAPIERKGVKGFRIEISAMKNSLGEGNRSLPIEFTWINEGGQQVSRWDWNTATTQMIYDHLRKRTYPQIEEFFRFDRYNDSHRTCQISALGHTKPVSFAQAGRDICNDPDLVRKFQKVYGIHQVDSFFKEGVPWQEQKQKALELHRKRVKTISKEVVTADPEASLEEQDDGTG